MSVIENIAQRKWRVRMLLLHGAMLAVPLVLLLTHSLRTRGFGLCAFKALVGVDCPACGVTRSAIALFSGRPIQAIYLQPVTPIIIIIILIMVLYLIVVVFTKFKGLEWHKEVRVYTRMEMLALILLFIGWIGKSVIN
jgi:hypothetical protein